MALLQEFLDQNQHRNYPLTDGADGRDVLDSFTLSQSLITDMNLNVPFSADTDGFFISSVLIRSASMDITVSYRKPDTSIIEFGIFSAMPTNTPANSNYPLSTSIQPLPEDSEFSSGTGTITIGSVDAASQQPGYYEFDYGNGGL